MESPAAANGVTEPRVRPTGPTSQVLFGAWFFSPLANVTIDSMKTPVHWSEVHKDNRVVLVRATDPLDQRAAPLQLHLISGDPLEPSRVRTIL